jgi:hypothetical protein
MILKRCIFNFIFALVIFISIFEIGNTDGTIEYSELCPEHTGLFYEPCMKHCTDKYSGNACGNFYKLFLGINFQNFKIDA